MSSHERRPHLHTRIRRQIRGWRLYRRILLAHERRTLGIDTERGNRVTLLTEGKAAYESMLHAVARASRHIHLEIYQFESDGIGWRFARALMEKARQGVQVRVIYDAVGSIFSSSSMWYQLEAAGAEVHCYHPLAPWRRGWAWNRRDHRKILIVDGQIGFTGGMNIADEHVPVEEGGGGWRDTHLRIEGPAIADLQLVFLGTWMRVGGTLHTLKSLFDVTPDPDGITARVVSNRTFRSRRSIRKTVLRAFDRAREKIHITHAYFIPDPGLTRALVRAVRRGVDVHLIVPSFSDVAIALAAGRAAQPRLLRNGIRISRRLGRVLHSKTIVIDDSWALLGSCNLNYRSFLINLEVNVEIPDRGFARQLESVFQADLAQSVEITWRDLESRPSLQRFLDMLAYSFRFWL